MGSLKKLLVLVELAFWGLLSIEIDAFGPTGKIRASPASGSLFSRIKHHKVQALGKEDAPLGLETDRNIFVCTNVWCQERGGLATLSTFLGLAGAAAGAGGGGGGGAGAVNVDGVSCLGRCKRGPNVRCQLGRDAWLDFSGVDSVDQARQILVETMGVPVSQKVATCLDMNLKGNYYLANNKVGKALEHYDRALAAGRGTDQEGVVALMRATARLQRALGHRGQMEGAAQRVGGMAAVAAGPNGRLFFQELSPYPRLLAFFIKEVARSFKKQESRFDEFMFKKLMYDHSIAEACEDAVLATRLLPNFPQSWIRAGEVYTELKMFKAAEEHYEVAMALNRALEGDLRPVVARLAKSRRHGAPPPLDDDDGGARRPPPPPAAAAAAGSGAAAVDRAAGGGAAAVLGGGGAGRGPSSAAAAAAPQQRGGGAAGLSAKKQRGP